MKATSHAGTMQGWPPVVLGTVLDIPALECIVRDSFENPWSTRLLLGAVRNEQYDVHVIRNDAGTALAVTIAHTVSSDSNLDMLAVSPPQRGHGIGRYLTKCWIERSRERGLTRLTLQVNSGNREAQRLYASLGFSTAGMLSDYYPNGDAAFDMHLRL